MQKTFHGFLGKLSLSQQKRSDVVSSLLLSPGLSKDATVGIIAASLQPRGNSQNISETLAPSSLNC